MEAPRTTCGIDRHGRHDAAHVVEEPVRGDVDAQVVQNEAKPFRNQYCGRWDFPGHGTDVAENRGEGRAGMPTGDREHHPTPPYISETDDKTRGSAVT